MDAVSTEAPFPVYLDYNATTPLDEHVIAEIHRSLVEDWGNPSSSHVYGDKAKGVIEQSRESVARMLNANVDDIIFMSGGTEANNVALLSVIDLAKSSNRDFIPHVITTNVEHDSVSKVLKEQARLGKIELSMAKVDDEGQLDAARVLTLINENTRLISIMHANNETGVIMPIQELGDILSSINKKYKEHGKPQIFFHCDAAQTIGKIEVDIERMKVDFLTVVGHKFYAPRIGALFARNAMSTSTPLKPLVHGGGQERGLRPGTENTPMIAGFGKAAKLVYENLTEYRKVMETLKFKLANNLQKNISGLKVNFPLKDTLPNTLSICLPEGLQASVILGEKCKGKLLASLGAACHSNTGKPSEILLESGLSPSEAIRTVRLSVGRTTTVEEVDAAVKYLKYACENP